MGLNLYKEEAKVFLESIDAVNESPLKKITFLEEEFNLLKKYLEIDNTDKIRHQIYDMLFILFEIAADFDFDLDTEWEIGKEKKSQYNAQAE